MGHYKLEELQVYQLAEEIGDEIWETVLSWDHFAKDTIGKQFVRAADSISANIAEGYGRFHFKENKNFCYFSRGSLLETKGWLTKAHKRGLVTEPKFSDIIVKLQQLHYKLNAYIKFIGNTRADTNALMTNDQ